VKLEGVFAAMVTPFSDDGSRISVERLEGYVEFLISRKVSGLFALGTTGEWPLLSVEERRLACETLVRSVGGRVPLIVHCGANSTEVASELARHARGLGVAAISIIAPGFYPHDDDALVDHFTAVARSAPDTPVFLYNIPSLTLNDITPETALRAASLNPNIIGIKYSGDDTVRFHSYRRRLGPDFSLFCGNDSMASAWLGEGADGLVSGNASAFPEMLVRLYAAFRRGDGAAGLEGQAELDEIIANRDESRELSLFKHSLAFRGVEVGDVRPPLRRLTADGLPACERQITALCGRGILDAAAQPPTGGGTR